MVSLDVTITLPDELASQAKVHGLLTPEALTQLISDELKRRRREIATPLLHLLPDADKGELTEADVAAEVRAYRAEQRALREGRR